LPNEENRAYFATAEDAEAAGYRAAGQTTQV
jgi:methylphosphotriester-DNA--protein-cysteine methyltransferase